MFKSLHIRNFQGHLDSTLNFSPGINVIAGISGAGKSSVVRAIYWLVQNRPLGVGFRSHWTKIKKEKGERERREDREARESRDVTVVDLELTDGHRIARSRTEKDSSYVVDGQALVALRSDVPMEVSSVLDMGEQNIQRQLPPEMFLLSDAPGDVARKLNNVVGLQVIEVVTQEATAIVLGTRRDADRTQAKITELTERKSKLDFIPALEERVLYLEEFSKNVGEWEKYRDRLSVLVGQLKSIQERIGPVAMIAKAVPHIQELEAQAGRIQALRTRSNVLAGKILDLRTLDSKIAPLRKMADAHAAILALEPKKNELIAKSQRATNLLQKLTAIRHADKMIATLRSDLESKRAQIAKLQELSKICPACGQPLPHPPQETSL
jgi:exonuclease SbcC